MVTCSALTPADGHGGNVGLAEMERVCRPGGLVVIVWPNEVPWLAAHGYRYVSFGDDQMMVEFSSPDEAAELTEIFYPRGAEEVREPRLQTRSIPGAGRQPAARPGVQADRAMSVAIVAPLVSAIREPQRGGSQAFLSDLARGLAAEVTRSTSTARAARRCPGVRVIDTGVDPETLAASLYRVSGSAAGDHPASQAAFAGVYAAVRTGRYDVVHNHAFDAPAIALAGGLRAPVVHTLHLPPDAAVADAVRAAARSEESPTIAVVSAAQARAWGGVVAVDAILPPLVPTRAIRFSPSAGDGAVFAGRLSPEKGARRGDRDRPRRRGPDPVFGDAYDADYASERIAPRGTEPGVDVHAACRGRRSGEEMASAAVVLCPAMWDEPFGMVAAEAQACGTPVVAFRRGALDEVIIDGVTGFLVAPGDIGAAAERRRASRGCPAQAAASMPSAELDLELSLDAHERLYQRVARGRARGSAGG